MDFKELREIIMSQAFTLQKAKTRGVMVNQEKERMRNVLMNNLDDIVKALDFAVDAQQKIDRLMVEIESADAELTEKDDEIKALKNQKQKTGKTKDRSPDVE